MDRSFEFTLLVCNHFFEKSIKHLSSLLKEFYFTDSVMYNYITTLKGQCHKIFECWFFFIKKLFLVPLEVPWDDFNFCRRFIGILNKKLSQRCMIHCGMGTQQCILHCGMATWRCISHRRMATWQCILHPGISTKK